MVIPSTMSAACTVEEVTGKNPRIRVSGCEYEVNQGSLKYVGEDGKGEFGGNIVFILNSVRGYIPEIKAQNNEFQVDASGNIEYDKNGNPVKSTHTLEINDSSGLSIGKMYVNYNGLLDMRKSSVAFTEEGLRTDSVKLTDSTLLFSGENNNSIIGVIEADKLSNVDISKKATVEIRNGEVHNRLNVIEGSTVIFNYNEISQEENKEKVLRVNIVNLKDSTLTKKGKGEVKFTDSFFSGDYKIIVEEGILDVSSIGLASTNSEFLISGGTLKFNQGEFKSKVKDGGKLHYSSETFRSSIEVNSDLTPKTAEGEVLVQGNKEGMIIKNSNINILTIKSGSVRVDANNSPQKNHISHLKIEGGEFRPGYVYDPSSVYTIDISNNGTYYYTEKGFSNLQSLKISDGGVFSFGGTNDLILDGSKIDIDASNGGVIRVDPHNNAKLVLKNIDKEIYQIDMQASTSVAQLQIGEKVKIGKLNLNTSMADHVFDIDGGNIRQIDMRRRGTLNIKGTAVVEEIVNSSPFSPDINIYGGKIGALSLNNSGNVNIDGNANIGIINLTGVEKVTLKGGNVGEFNVLTQNNRAEVNIIDGVIETFRLETLVKLKLENTIIRNYEISLKDQTFDFTQKNVENLWVKGKGSTVTVGGYETVNTLNNIKLDRGKLIYSYDKDKSFVSWTTTINHPETVVKPCDPDKEECKEEDKEPEVVYDSEFVVKAGKATVTVNTIKLENLNLESGNLIVNDSMEIQRKLTLGIEEENKINKDRADLSYKIYSKGNVSLSGLLEVEFRSTHSTLLGMENNFSIIHSDTEIKIDTENEETKFKFLTNLAEWFVVDYKIDNGQDFIVNIRREKSYSEVLDIYGYSGGFLEVAGLLDAMLMGKITMPKDMEVIITGLDTQSKGGKDLSNNLSKLMPVSNRVYANNIHLNTNRSVDNLSMELRDFSNLEDNIWVKLQYNLGKLKNKKDVVGYNDNSRSMQTGYTRIVNSKLLLGGSFSYVDGGLYGKDSSYNENYTAFNLSLGADYLINSDYYLKGILSYSYTMFDNTRNINFINYSNNSDIKADEFMAHFEAGYITILPDKYRNFNATYNVFYSISKIGIGSYYEEGIGALNVDGANVLVNDFGVGVTFDRELLYDREEVSLKPYASLATGIRIYSGANTSFKFQSVDSDSLTTTNGSYLPIFVKAGFGVDYIADWATVSVGYRMETDVNKYVDSSFQLSFKRSF